VLIDLGQTTGAAGEMLRLDNGDLCRNTNDGVYPGGMTTAILPTP